MRSPYLLFFRTLPVAILIVFVFSFSAKGQFQVVINEVMIDGPGPCDGAAGPNCSPHAEEWIELYNTACVAVNIGCYRICDGDFCITIPSGTIIPAQGYYLIGSNNSPIGSASLDLNFGTCADCVSAASTSLIGVLTNTNEQLVLTNSAGVIVDAIIWGGGQALPAAQVSTGSCGPLTVTLPSASNAIYENIGPSGGGNGCVMARSIDGSNSWEARCAPATHTPGASNNPSLTASAALTICAGQSITLTAGGGTGLYSWSPSAGLGGTVGGSVVATPTGTTTYTVTSVSLSGCLMSSTATVTVTVTPPPVVTIASSQTSPVCAGQPVNLTASGANNYTWSTGQTGAVITVSPSTTTTYSVTGSNAPNCSSSAGITMLVTPPPNVAATAASQTICAGTSTFLTATGATAYTWNTGQTGAVISVNPTSSTTYTV